MIPVHSAFILRPVSPLSISDIKFYCDNGSVPLVVSTSRSFPRSKLIIGFVTRLTRRVPQVEQDMRTLTENVSSSPVFSVVLVTRSLVLRVTFCRSLPFLFLLVIVLSVLLRFANYDYPFDIFKLFLVNFCTNGTIYTSLFDLA